VKWICHLIIYLVLITVKFQVFKMLKIETMYPRK